MLLFALSTNDSGLGYAAEWPDPGAEGLYEARAI
jgi:hypothetical protein